MTRVHIGHTVTTQRTGKFWKLLQLVAVLGILVGFVWCIVAYSNFPESHEGPKYEAASMEFAKAVLTTGAGVVLWIFSRIGAWWFHG